MSEIKKLAEAIKAKATVVSDEESARNLVIEGVAPASKNEKKKTKVDEIQKEIERKQKELQEVLQVLSVKKTLSEHREQFIVTLDKLDEIENKLKDKPMFEQSEMRLTFSNHSYDSKPYLAIGNTALLYDFVQYLRTKIKEKVTSIEEELIK